MTRPYCCDRRARCFCARYRQQVAATCSRIRLPTGFCNHLEQKIASASGVASLLLTGLRAILPQLSSGGLATMESNISNQQYFNGAAPLTEPHFDEEATLLSARPVVPLQKIKSKERSRQRLVFGAAIVSALMVGALGATLIYKQRGQEPPTAIVSTAVPGAAGIAGDQAVSSPSIAEAVATATLPEAGTGTVDEKAVPWVSRSPAAPVVETKRKRSMRQQLDQGELRRAERIDLHGFRSRSEREAQRESGRKRKSSDDLLRIREIFEGPSRP